MKTYFHLALVKAAQIDYRHIRIALVIAAFLATKIVPMGIPIGGDVNG